MPELPEVEVVRRSLAGALAGRRVDAVQAKPVRLRDGIEPGQWPPLVGRALETIDRRGKFLVVRFGDHAAVLHLGMSGRLLLRGPGAAAESHTHLIVEFEGGIGMHLVDPRRFGSATVCPVVELQRHRSLAGLGPDALAADVGRAVAVAAAGSRAPIRNVLLDQTVVAGVGNIYAAEALARAGIRPTRPGRTISRARLARLGEAIHAVLADALAAGGTTLADRGFADADGQLGTFAVDLAVYGRENLPCRRCQAAIRRVVVAGRSTFYCPRCQR